MLRMLAAGAAMLVVLGTADAQQSRDAEVPQRQQGAREDAGAFLDARIAAMHAGLRLTAEQERVWPSFEQAYRDEAKQRLERKLAREQQPRIEDPVARMQRRADALSQSGATLRKLADAAAPLWRSFDEAQKRRFVALARPTGVASEWRFGERPNERTGALDGDPYRSGADRGPPRRDAEGRRAPPDAPGFGDYGRGPRRMLPGGSSGRDEEYGYGRQRRGMAPDEFRGGDRDADAYRRERPGMDERGGYGGRDEYGYGRQRRGMTPDEFRDDDRDADGRRGGRGMRRDEFTGRSMECDEDGGRDGRRRPFMGPDEPAGRSMRRDGGDDRDDGRRSMGPDESRDRPTARAPDQNGDRRGPRRRGEDELGYGAPPREPPRRDAEDSRGRREAMPRAPRREPNRDFGRDEGRGHFWWWHRRGDIDDRLWREGDDSAGRGFRGRVRGDSMPAGERYRNDDEEGL